MHLNPKAINPAKCGEPGDATQSSRTATAAAAIVAVVGVLPVPELEHPQLLSVTASTCRTPTGACALTAR